MQDRARIKINLAQREVEVEGSEPFVARYGERLEALLDRLQGPASAPSASSQPVQDDAPPSEPAPSIASFGEFVMGLPNGATEVDTMLAASYWVQKNSGDDAFSTSEVTRRLTEHGVRLGNPSQCVKQSLVAKRAFMVQKGRYRVSQQGRTHLRMLLGNAVTA